MLDTSPTDELPPPSYEVSQEVFDQKTRQGIQASLEPQPEDDLWEVWDEAKFESNAGAFIDGSASSSSSVPTLPPTTAQRYPKEKAPRLPSPPQHQQEESAVRPLRIVKKSQTAAYNKAVEARSYQSNLMPSGPTSSSDDRASSLSRSLSVFTLGRRTPPPMFEPVGPSLDGPDYAEVMSYVPGHSRPSSPMSTLSSDSHRPPILPPPRMTDSRPNMVMPPPPPPRIQHQPAPRPMPAQAQRPLYQRPARRIGFDPMSAYKSKSPFTPGLEPTPERIDPASFYNSAVSAHLSTVPQRSTINPTYRTSGIYQQELQHPQPHHAMAFDNFSGMGNMRDMNMGVSVGRERAMSVISTDSSYYPNPPVNLSPNRSWDYQPQPFHPNR